MSSQNHLQNESCFNSFLSIKNSNFSPKNQQIYHVLEHEGERGLGVNDVVEGDHVGVPQHPQQRRLADSRERATFFLLQRYFFQRHYLAGSSAF